MERLTTASAAATRDLFGLEVTPEFTRPDEQFGDYATNVALQLAGRLGKPPRVIADELATAVRERLGADVREVSVAGPGFINVFLSDAAMLAAATAAVGSTPAPTSKVVLVEYSDPNPFKPLHAGHLYTTLVGDMVARLQERAGHTVKRLNYGGDVGLHVGKSMWAIMRLLGDGPDALEALQRIPEADRPAWLGARYVEGNNAYEDDPAAKKQIVTCNELVYQVHAMADHESVFAQVYWTCRQWSYDYFTRLYKELAIHDFDRFIPESEVTPLSFQTVAEQYEAGVYEKSDGAIIFDGEKYGLHKRVFINSAGLPTYEAKDVGLLLTKWRDYHFDTSIVITANEQAQYMEVMLKSVEQFAPEPARRSQHLTHGLVKLKGGEKMSSRKGNIVTALDILAAARKAGEETGTNPSEDTILAAVKYALAKNRIGADIAYDPKESIALEGNSGPYLQYAHARARSILAKAGETAGTPAPKDALESDERSLARKISEYPDTVGKAVADLMPHHICTYLYELAQGFNRFYEHNRVIGDPRASQRLGLVRLYADVLKDGLELLGVAAPERL